MGRPRLHPQARIFSTQLATRILVATGVASAALPSACGGGTATVTTTGSSTSARGSGGAATTGGTGGAPVGSTSDTTTGGLFSDASFPDDALGPPPMGTDCFDWAADAGDCPTDPNAVVFELDKAGCADAGDGLSIEPNQINSGPTPTGAQCCYAVQYQYCITGGRPYLVAERGRVAPVRRRDVDADGWSSPGCAGDGLDALTAGERSDLAAAWTADALLEHASVASFARFSLALLAAGAPAELVTLAHRAALDEVRHAQLCFALASAYAGESVGPGPFPVGERVEVGGGLAALAASTVREGCVGETVAAVVAAEQLARATDPAVRAALTRIADDEARHAELAWRTVAWALEIGGDDVREAVALAFRAAMTAAQEPAGAEAPPAPSALEKHGRLDAATLANAIAAAMSGVVAPSARALLQGRGTGRVQAQPAHAERS